MVINKNLIYPDLSYKIIGILYDVYNKLGYGYQEKYYQRAIESALKTKGIKFKGQFFVRMRYQNQDIGNYRIDLLIEDRIVVEIKVGNRFISKNIKQTYAYLKATNLKLAILVNFTPYGITFKRIVNIE